MINPAQEILPFFTDSNLKEYALRGDGQRELALFLLSIPAEYRQPAEAKITAMTKRLIERNGLLTHLPLEMSVEEARLIVRAKLSEQGIPILDPGI